MSILCYFILVLSVITTPALSIQNNTPDFDNNGTVDFPDFLLFVNAFGSTNTTFDLNADTRVDFADFLIFVSVFGTTIVPSSTGGVYKSIDSGQTWVRKNCGLINSRITAVGINPTHPDTVIIGVEFGTASFTELQGQTFEGGLYRTTNGGENWTRTSALENHEKNGYWRILYRANQVFTFGLDLNDPTINTGFVKSTDQGQTWTSFDNHLRTQLVTNFDITPDGQTIYANPRDSFSLQKSTDGGQTWITSSINQANGPVAVSPADPNRVIYASIQTLYLSTDGVETVQKLLDTKAQISHIVFAPSDPTIVYVITYGYILFKSTDAGQNFTQLANLRTDVLDLQP